MKYTFALDVCNFAFMLEDESMDADLSDVGANPAWGLISLVPGAVVIHTARYSGRVAVTAEVRPARPAETFAAWDYVIECSLPVPSGVIAFFTLETAYADSPRITLEPGVYRMRIYYGNFDSIDDELALEGDDYYRIVLWQDEPTGPLLLKSSGPGRCFDLVPFSELTLPGAPIASIVLKDMVHVLGHARFSSLLWGIEAVDWMGAHAEVARLAHAVNVSPHQRLLVPGSQLLHVIDDVQQIRQGLFIGYQSPEAADRFLHVGRETALLATGTIMFIIEVVPGDALYMRTHFRTDAEMLARHFPQAHWVPGVDR